VLRDDRHEDPMPNAQTLSRFPSRAEDAAAARPEPPAVARGLVNGLLLALPLWALILYGVARLV
jgi:hypothetical protein